MNKWNFMSNPFGDVILDVFLKRNRITVLNHKRETCYDGDVFGAISFLRSVINLFINEGLMKTTLVFNLHYNDNVEAMTGSFSSSLDSLMRSYRYSDKIRLKKRTVGMDVRG
ncbi:MAG: hypothetical protein IAC23_08125 [Bacteroidetes bacterium]|uniref:Uncharacterized protein n=1 Tax=Candidatus Cryptobacteroides merdavium TaxID=2840769 RepID=A0A9D9ED91_9BACT|nr:hypothetical protein [Candidatus Cryptobacteroides merdavium]